MTSPNFRYHGTADQPNISGCPYRTGRLILKEFNDLAITHPQLAQEWATDLNAGKTLQQVSAGSSQKAWWRCQFGHTWKTTVNPRALSYNGCPSCAGYRVEPGVNSVDSYPELLAQWDNAHNGHHPHETHAGSNTATATWWQCPESHR